MGQSHNTVPYFYARTQDWVLVVYVIACGVIVLLGNILVVRGVLKGRRNDSVEPDEDIL